jgi:hypothetical protein
VDRRRFLRLSGGGAVAAMRAAWPLFWRPGGAVYAQATMVHWLRWTDFVPASDQVLRNDTAAAGYADGKFPETWEQYREAGKKLKAKGRPLGQTLGHGPTTDWESTSSGEATAPPRASPARLWLHVDDDVLGHHCGRPAGRRPLVAGETARACRLPIRQHDRAPSSGRAANFLRSTAPSRAAS